MFVCQSVKQDFDIKDFIEEQDLETLNVLYGEDWKEYSTYEYEDSSNEINFDVYDADLVMTNINNEPAMMLYPIVLPNQPSPLTYVWYKIVLKTSQLKL